MVMLLLGAGTGFFILRNHTQLRRLPGYGTLLTVFYVLLFSWLMTVLEGFFWPDVLNDLEHAGYALGAVLMALWCWKIFKGKPG
jgi:hypothetical protein